jgi:hypothetical protein
LGIDQRVFFLGWGRTIEIVFMADVFYVVHRSIPSVIWFLLMYIEWSLLLFLLFLFNFIHFIQILFPWFRERLSLRWRLLIHFIRVVNVRVFLYQIGIWVQRHAALILFSYLPSHCIITNI